MNAREAKCYLAGCLKGDAWITSGKQALCLRCADYEFAKHFSRCLYKAFGLFAKVSVDERGYYLVRKCHKPSNFKSLLTLEPKSDREKRKWLQGVFDSEGSVEAKQTLRNDNWNRRIAMFSTNKETLLRVQKYLSHFNIEFRPLAKWSMTEGHLGNKQVYAVVLKSSQRNFFKFQRRVGFNIFRHQVNVIRLCCSYSVKSRKELAREAQAKGAEVKRQRFLKEIFPQVLKSLKEYIKSGGKPTIVECSKHVFKYSTALNYFNHRFLLEKIQ